jgi:hypothetical protein
MNIISIDWLQLYCTTDNLILNEQYIWHLAPYQTKQFRILYEISYQNEEFATLCMNPVSHIIPGNAVIIKFKNRQLYFSEAINHFKIFLSDCNLIYKSITRVDIAVDLNKFKNGLLPTTFIDKFMKCNFLKVGRGKFTLIGEQKFTHTYQYLRFGTKSSEVSVYLYNKSIELQQVQDKPYIRNVWEKQGLDINKDIWRLEISIKSAGTNYVDLNTGEYSKINYLNLANPDYLNTVFSSYINQYFYFVVNDGQLNKTRMQKVDLLQLTEPQFKPLYVPNTTGSNRSDKIFAKKLYMLDQELRGFNDDMITATKEVLSDFIIQTDLMEYVNKRRDMWQRSAYREN